MSATAYDAIVIGAGHNGLVAAAYLARAGLKAAVFEARHVVGGAAVTEELWPGFRISRCSYVNSLFRPEIVSELGLRKHGFEMLPRDPSSFSPFPDRRSLLLGPENPVPSGRSRSFRRRMREAFPKYEAMLGEIAEVLEPMLGMVPPNPGKLWPGGDGDLRALRAQAPREAQRAVARDLPALTCSGRDLLDEWFESEELKVTLATDAVIGANASPSLPGTAYILFHHVMGECNGVRGVWGYMRGGMGGLSESLAEACRALGVEIHSGSPVERMLVTEGRATGVVAEGNEYTARAVV